MLSHGNFFAKYGTQTTFYFALEDATDAEAPFVGVAPVTADIWLVKDGGVAANATNGCTAEGNGVYSLVLTAAEMQATIISVSIYDQTASAIFLPVFFNVVTRLYLGQFDIDATQIGSNTDALKLTGVGTGVGLYTSGASAAYYTNLFSQLEGTEPSGAPADNATVMAMLQFLKRRWNNKRTQSSTTFTMYKDDSTTTAWTATVSDDGTIGTVAKGA